MKFTQALFTFAMTTVLSSCATTHAPYSERGTAYYPAPAAAPTKPAMSKSECHKIKSYKLGLVDGQQGKARSSEFATLTESCSVHKVKLQPKQYSEGWTQGNKTFCQSKNLFKLGKEGQSFPEACQNQRVAQRAFEKGQKAVEQRASAPSEQLSSNSGAISPAPAVTVSELTDLENQLQEILENKEQIKNDLDFFRDGVVHNQRESQLQELSAREETLREQIKSFKQANSGKGKKTHLSA